MVDIFISYKREERSRCEPIAAKLRALGLDVWFDAKLESGKSFDREIEDCIAKAKAVLVLWSPTSVQSRWVRDEAGFALNKDKLVAATLAPCTLPIAFSSIHFEDLHDPNFQDDDPSWLRMLDRISKLVNRPSIVSFSQALAQAAIPLEQWARLNPTDSLATQMRSKAALLGGVAPHMAGAGDKRPRGSIVAAIIAGIVGLALGGVGATLAAPLLQSPPPPVEAAAPTADDVGATLVGKWRLVSDTSCTPQNTIEILMGRGVLRTFVAPGPGASAESAMGSSETIGALNGTWLQTTGADGAVYEYRRDGSQLRVRVRGASEETLMDACT